MQSGKQHIEIKYFLFPKSPAPGVQPEEYMLSAAQKQGSQGHGAFFFLNYDTSQTLREMQRLRQ